MSDINLTDRITTKIHTQKPHSKGYFRVLMALTIGGIGLLLAVSVIAATLFAWDTGKVASGSPLTSESIVRLSQVILFEILVIVAAGLYGIYRLLRGLDIHFAKNRTLLAGLILVVLISLTFGTYLYAQSSPPAAQLIEHVDQKVTDVVEQLPTRQNRGKQIQEVKREVEGEIESHRGKQTNQIQQTPPVVQTPDTTPKRVETETEAPKNSGKDELKTEDSETGSSKDKSESNSGKSGQGEIKIPSNTSGSDDSRTESDGSSNSNSGSGSSGSGSSNSGSGSSGSGNSDGKGKGK
jgi:uncharacterized membrane protein YgcG